MMGWKTEVPTKSGIYFCYGKNVSLGDTEVFVMNVNVEDGDISFTLNADGYEVESIYMIEDVTHWFGPITVPPPPTKEN